MTKKKSKLPSITIVTPSFNQGKFIERTIESVLGQNYPNLEYIVVDGGSTDETIAVLKKYEGRLRWISEKDKGQSDAINKGFRMAKGEIVAWLNSDDVYLPGALNKAGAYFAQHPEVMMVYGEGYMIDEHDAIKSRFPFTEPKFDLWKLIYYGDYILQQSTFFRRSIFESIDMLSESLHYTMDWDLFIRIGKRFRVDYIPEYLGSIREHGEAKTSTGGKVRFREIKKLVRYHGVQRFPLAYFNYAWDVYGKVFSNGTAGVKRSSVATLALTSARHFLEKLYSAYHRRIAKGIYEDGWAGKRAMVVLPEHRPDQRKRRIIVEGEAMGPNIPFVLSVKVNRKPTGSRRIVAPGRFEVALSLPFETGDLGCYHVELQSHRAFVPASCSASKDVRELAFHLNGIRLEQ